MMEDKKHEVAESAMHEKKEHGKGMNMYTKEERMEMIKKAAKRYGSKKSGSAY